MTGPELAAALAGGLGVAGAWEALQLVDPAEIERRAAGVLAPLRASSGSAPTAPEERRLVVVGVAVMLLAGWMLVGAPGALVLGCGAPWAVRRLTAARRRRWERALAAGAAPAARAMGDALAGGHSLRGAIAEAGRSADGVAATQLALAAHALELGETTDAVLDRLRAAATDSGWATIVAAVRLQRRSGGDLARLLRELADTLDDRERAEAAARGATAQARFTGSVVAVMPAGAAAIAVLAAPRTMLTILHTPVALALVVLGVVLIACGLAAIRRIAAGVGV